MRILIYAVVIVLSALVSAQHYALQTLTYEVDQRIVDILQQEKRISNLMDWCGSDRDADRSR